MYLTKARFFPQPDPRCFISLCSLFRISETRAGDNDGGPLNVAARLALWPAVATNNYLKEENIANSIAHDLRWKARYAHPNYYN